MAERIEQNKYEFTFPEQKQVANEKYPTEILNSQVNLLRNCSALKWDGFCNVIQGEISDCTKEQLDTLMKCFIAYYQEFIKTVLDIKRLHFHLVQFLCGTEAEKKDIQKTILEIGNQIGVATEGVNNYFKKHSPPKYTQVYFAEDVYSLVRLEMNLIHEIDRDFRKCQLCGKYFVPYTSQNIYCKNPNVLHGNLPCNEVGPNMSYRKSRLDNPLTKEFDKNYKSYYKWCQDNREKYSDVPEIAIDIEKVFELWKKSAQRVLESFECGECSYEDAWKNIQKPEKHKRSEKLHKMKKYGTYEWP